MPPMIEFPLDLPEVRVLKTELKKREIVITVESTRPYAICSRCGQKTFEFHSYDDPIRLRHLPILEQRVFIELRPKRFRCPTCDDHPTTTQQLWDHKHFAFVSTHLARSRRLQALRDLISQDVVVLPAIPKEPKLRLTVPDDWSRLRAVEGVFGLVTQHATKSPEASSRFLNSIGNKLFLSL